MARGFRRKLLWTGSIGVLLVAGFVWWRWPAFEIRAWKPVSMPPASGVWQTNHLLHNTQMVGGAEMIEPEDAIMDKQGRLYGSCKDGKIRRVHPDGKVDVFADTQGRPLGMTFGPDGTLYVADGMKGLLAISAQGKVQVLVDSYRGKKMYFVDDLDLTPDGMLYFTDASQLVQGTREAEVRPDVLSHVPTGRLFQFNLNTRQLTLVRDGLYFANGVVLSHDQSMLLVAETSTYRILWYGLKGPKQGKWGTFAENLRGFPDNINRSSDGGYWVALTSPRLGYVDRWIHPRAWLKKLLMTLPEPLLPKPIKASVVVKLNHKGEVVQTLQDPTGKVIANACSANEYNGILYLGHLYHNSPGIGKLELRKSSLPAPRPR